VPLKQKKLRASLRLTELYFLDVVNYCMLFECFPISDPFSERIRCECTWPFHPRKRFGRKPGRDWMQGKIIVAYDGSEASRRAVTYAADEARQNSSKLVIAHVLEWSPYSFLTQEELAERHKRRGEEMDRARDAVVVPVLSELLSQGIPAESEIRYGHVAETLCEIATDVKARNMVVGRTGSTGMAARLFGSVAVTLAQIAPVPVTIVP